MITKLINILRQRRSAHRDPVAQSIKELAEKAGIFSFLQIGSSDGGLNDPLKSYISARRARGIFVEPIPASLRILQNKYAGYNDLFYENCAIDTRSDARILYRISEERGGLPEWAYQVASFDRQILLNHVHSIPDVASRIIEQIVPCQTVDEILNKHGITELDCLHIDTEGHDYAILKGFPFHRVMPQLVIFEHKHLSNEAMEGSISLLGSMQYSLTIGYADMIAKHKSHKSQ